MLPVVPPEKAKLETPQLNEITMKSPAGVPEAECGDLKVLYGVVKGGVYDGGPIVRTFWKPSEEEIAYLQSGGLVELEFYCDGMPMTAMNVTEADE